MNDGHISIKARPRSARMVLIALPFVLALAALCVVLGVPHLRESLASSARIEPVAAPKDIVQHTLLMPDESLLRRGDVVLVLGESPYSRAMRVAYPDDAWSHVGILDHGPDGWMVIHATPAGRAVVIREPLDAFLSQNQYVRGTIYRVDALDRAGDAAADYAAAKADANVPFDPQFDDTEDARQYCSELVWNAWMAGGVDLAEDRRREPHLPFLSQPVILPDSLAGAACLKPVIQLVAQTKQSNTPSPHGVSHGH